MLLGSTFFFFNDTATTEIYTLSLHDALPIFPVQDAEGSYVKIIDSGRQVICNRIEGYLSSRLAFFLMQIRPTERPIRSEEHTSELQAQSNLGCRLLL